MSDSSMMLHKGAEVVSRAALEVIPAPEATATWFPRSHAEVIESVEFNLQNAGFGVVRSQYAVANKGLRMFATMDLNSLLAEGVSLAVGVRNSNDKSFPMGWCAGSRVFVCDNLAFSAQFGGELSISKRHTRNGSKLFGEALTAVVAKMIEFKESESKRIALMQEHEITAEQADSFILQSFEQDLVSTRLLGSVIKEWRTPRHDEFAPRTVWSLLNAFTEAMKPVLSQPTKYTARTIRIQSLMTRDDRYKPVEIVVPTDIAI